MKGGVYVEICKEQNLPADTKLDAEVRSEGF